MLLLPVGFDQPVTQPLSFTEMAQLELPPRVPRSVMVYVVAEAISRAGKQHGHETPQNYVTR